MGMRERRIRSNMAAAFNFNGDHFLQRRSNLLSKLLLVALIIIFRESLPDYTSKTKPA
jgi:hypothetical protein